VTVATRRRPDFERELQLVERALLEGPEHEGARSIIDLSCGPARMARSLAKTERFDRVFGVDRSWPMLEQAISAGRRAGRDDVDYLLADVRHLPFETASIHGVHAGAALHLWPDLPRCLSEVARVLTPGGRFVASTFVHTEQKGIRYGLEVAFERSTNTRVFGLEELTNLLAGAGLHQVGIERWNSFVLVTSARDG